MRIKSQRSGLKVLLKGIGDPIPRNRVKHANVSLSKLIYNPLAKESGNFEDVKVEESSPRLVNIFLASFQGFEGVPSATHPCPIAHGYVSSTKNVQ